MTFVVKNNCPYTVWPGTLTAAGRPTISSTGFTLATSASPSLSVPATWSGACGQEHNALHIPQDKWARTLTDKIALDDVLCIPSFSFNLISVKRLTENLNCCLVFINNTCFI